jgi:L-fuculose-phosphate aldolase
VTYYSDQEARDAIIETGHQLYSQGLTVGTDGNISCRVSENTLWTTATGARKGFLTDEWLVKTDLQGNILEGTRQPSSELKMHLCLYTHNPRAFAAVHTHPPFSTAFAAANLGFDDMLLAEEGLYLGHVQVAPYATPGTATLAESIIPFCRENNAVLLSNHGAVTWGKTLSEACSRMETLERCARIRYYCLTLGKTSYLSPEEAAILHQKGVALGHFEV